jgi:hypothetical protein
MSGDPRPDEAGRVQVHSPAPESPGAAVPFLASNGARSGRNTAFAGSQAQTKDEGSATLVLRSELPPADQLDYDDRHDTRATESDALARRYGDLRRDRRRDDWHKLAMALIGFIVLTVMYLAGFIVVSRLLPHLGPGLAAKIVALAFVAASGGAAVRSAGQVLRRRTTRPRDRRSSRPGQ